MTTRSVFVEPGVVLADTHIAALRTLPVAYRLTDDAATADVIAGSAAYLHDVIVAGSLAQTAVLVAPRSEPWDDVDALWAAVEYRDIAVVPASIDVDAVQQFSGHFDAILRGQLPYLVEVHLESLGVEETRLAQVVSLLDTLGITCPEFAVRATGSGWVAVAADAQMTLRAHCVRSSALSPCIRIRVSSAHQQCSLVVPMGPDARPLTVTVSTSIGTTTTSGAFESPARAFWMRLNTAENSR